MNIQDAYGLMYSVLLSIAQSNLEDIDNFFGRAQRSRKSEQRKLEQSAASSTENGLDDLLDDEFAQLKEFSWLYAEFAVIGLWRCIELHRKSAMRAALGAAAAKRAYIHKQFQKDLLRLKIEEKKIRCARSVDELRCLNNAIKHERRVNGKLAEFPQWKNKEGDELGDLENQYLRLRPLTKRYLEDLTERLINAKISRPSPAGQVSKT